MRERVCAVAVLATWTACAGVSIDPASADATRIAPRALSAAEQQQVDALVATAMQAVVRRSYDDAGNAARAALALDPRSARARAVLGMVRLQAASLVSPPDLFAANEAEHEMRLATQLGPDDAFVGWMWAVFLAETGHVSAAAEAAEQALARATAAPASERAALLGIAGTYRYELGEERAALPHLQGYLDLRPDDATASFRLGSALLRIAAVPQGIPPTSIQAAQRQAEAAARAFARCVELAPGDEDAALAIATAFWRAAELAHDRDDHATAERHRQAAAEQLRAVAERFPQSPEPWFRLGVMAEAQKAPAEARAAYTEALRRDASHVPTMLDFAALLAASGQREEADALLRQAATVDASLPSLTPEERQHIRRRLAPPPGGPDQKPRML